jgi:hypothetical protein
MARNKYKQTIIVERSYVHMNSMDDNKDKSSERVNYMTQDEFDKEWKKLFPLGDKELPALLRGQAE